MLGENNLETLIRAMEPELQEDVFVFCTTPKEFSLPRNISPQALFQEKEGTTLILRERDAKEAGLDYAFPSRMITLNIHSSLEAVGFMAVIASCLAKNDISVNPVSAFFHDHLFVPKDKAALAMRLLKDLSNNATKPSSYSVPDLHRPEP